MISSAPSSHLLHPATSSAVPSAGLPFAPGSDGLHSCRPIGIQFGKGGCPRGRWPIIGPRSGRKGQTSTFSPDSTAPQTPSNLYRRLLPGNEPRTLSSVAVGRPPTNEMGDTRKALRAKSNVRARSGVRRRPVDTERGRPGLIGRIVAYR